MLVIPEATREDITLEPVPMNIVQVDDSFTLNEYMIHVQATFAATFIEDIIGEV